MDILACPICKNFPLRLIVFEEEEGEGKEVEEVICELFCGYHQIFISKLNKERLLEDCKRCFKVIIKEAIIICDRCGRWYPVSEEIPRMMPDELRKEEDDKKFLERYKEKIPEKVLKEGRPFHL